MLKIVTDSGAAIFTNDPGYTPGSADNVNIYDLVHLLDDEDDHLNSKHAIHIESDHGPKSCILLAGGGVSGIHDNSAAVIKNRIYFAVGPFVACLDFKSLAMIWSVKADWATCFGVHIVSSKGALISHGELAISRISLDGQIEWQAGGADIFTGTLEIKGSYVRVTDFCGRHYRFDLVSGSGAYE